MPHGSGSARYGDHPRAMAGRHIVKRAPQDRALPEFWDPGDGISPTRSGPQAETFPPRPDGEGCAIRNQQLVPGLRKDRRAQATADPAIAADPPAPSNFWQNW